ncbi:MAG: hypothetical protein WD208_04605 [Dehalococcoidia bacterium]
MAWPDTTPHYIPSKDRQMGRRGGSPPKVVGRSGTHWVGALIVIIFLALLLGVAFLINR